MFKMFSAKAFNQPLNNWDVSNVRSMGYMFYKAATFNQNISMWDVKNVTNWELFSVGANNLTDEMIPEKFRTK